MTHKITSWRDEFTPDRVDHKRICPSCSKRTGVAGSWYDPLTITEPVFLIKRVNRSAMEEFWGCPNFPKCRYSWNPPYRHRVEINGDEEMCCHDFQG